MQLGAVDYLEKPVSPERIAWVLDTHLRRSSTAV
jgi:DNA-binding response OmpR family regulator